MTLTRLTCNLCLPGPQVVMPLEFAAAMVFHAVMHHGVTLEDIAAAVRVRGNQRDRYSPARASWRLPNDRSWLSEWEAKERPGASPIPAMAQRYDPNSRARA